MQKSPVQPNDVYQKASGLSSKWLVERIIEFPDLPLHVRLNEQGGNERTVTVALSALLDPRQWKLVKAAEPQEEEPVSEKQTEV
ncbi:MAG: hypothetical protein IJ846_03555 [Alphaproteobacteria bacterium]|nr:hypothetical protein [Alphaproteobacteria bacterium]